MTDFDSRLIDLAKSMQAQRSGPADTVYDREVAAAAFTLSQGMTPPQAVLTGDIAVKFSAP